MTTTTTTIEAIFAAVLAVMDRQPGRRAVDPFSFDADPRDSETAWYVDPPSTTSTGGFGVESVQATFTVWISRPAAADAAAAAVALAGSLSRLRHALAALDVDDVNVQSTIPDVRPRDAQAVTVIGRIAVAFDYEADSEHP